MHKRMISKETVRNAARLAGIRIHDNEVERYRAELERILDYFRILDEIDTEGIEAVRHAVDGALREDEIQPCLPCSSLHLEQGFFRVPKGSE
jgi:aspartyl-tRNA(Asn)/glutamyl-tRNA(Gln) amidotransferase subunit C